LFWPIPDLIIALRINPRRFARATIDQQHLIREIGDVGNTVRKPW
jgi:hypothetical protein